MHVVQSLQAEALQLCFGALLDGVCGLQELPRLPESLLHPEGPMPGVSVGSYSFKMPGMDGWNGSPAPWQPPPQQQQLQQPPEQQQQQQQGGHVRRGARLDPYVPHLFPQPRLAVGRALLRRSRRPEAASALGLCRYTVVC